jgi:telomere-associated protein RIF1
MVDAFFPTQSAETAAQETVVSPLVLREHASVQVKRIKLIMVPLCRVLSSSHSIVLRSSCLSTWHYLLRKLGHLINHLPILEAAFAPIFKIVFSIGINDLNKPLWSFCMSLFYDFVLSKVGHGENFHTPALVNWNLLAQSCKHLKALLDVEHIKWLPWGISCFHFHLEILSTILNPDIFLDMIPEMIVIVMDFATQILRLLLQGVTNELKGQLAYGQVSECIANMCKFVKKFFLDDVGKHNGNKSAMLLQFGLRFVNIIVEELGHSLLASEKFEICLDIEHIKMMQYAESSPKVSCPEIRSLSYNEMVSPGVHMTAMSLSMVAEFTGELSHDIAEKLSLILISPDILENFHAAVSFMYMQLSCPVFNRTNIKWLVVWNKVAKHLNKQNNLCMEVSPGSSSHDVLYRFFCYPFFTLLYPGPQCVCPNSGKKSETCAPVTQDLGVELALEVYRSLSVDSFCGSKTGSQVFLEGFYEYLVTVIDENMSLFQANLEHCSEKPQNAAILTLGEVLVGLLQNDQLLNTDDQELNEPNEDSTGCRQPSFSMSCMKIINRYLTYTS